MLIIDLKDGQSSHSIQLERLRKNDLSLCGVQRLKHNKLALRKPESKIMSWGD